MMLGKPIRVKRSPSGARTLARLVAISCAPLSAAQAGAATRTYIVTDYDSLRVEGPLEVTVETGRGASARGEGDRAALEQLEFRVSSRALTIRFKPSNEVSQGAGIGPVRISLTAPVLRRIQLSGSGTLRANGLDKSRADVASTGSGRIAITGIDSDILSVSQSGSGSITLSGKAKTVRLNTSGSGTLNANALRTSDLDVALDGEATLDAQADRAAKIVAGGSGNVTVTGSPACTVRQAGGGSVRCGGKSF